MNIKTESGLQFCTHNDNGNKIQQTNQYMYTEGIISNMITV